MARDSVGLAVLGKAETSTAVANGLIRCPITLHCVLRSVQRPAMLRIFCTTSATPGSGLSEDERV
jgi:hypothetical protein